MQVGNGTQTMTTNPPYKLGICSGTYNPETVNRVIKNLDVPCEASVLKSIEGLATSLMDTIFIINPVFDAQQKAAFLDYIGDGGTASVMIDMNSFSAEASADLLSTIGIKVKGKYLSKRLIVRYLAGYPKGYKVGKRKMLVSKKMTYFTKFGLLKNTGIATCIPLIAGQSIFYSFLFAIKVNFGKGTIIVLNSTHITEDLVDIIDHLLTLNPIQKAARKEDLLTEFKSRIFSIVNESFKIYQEIPIEVVYRKTDAFSWGISPVDMLTLIEELITAGDIYATIRGNVLVK
jgi:hypothetical protein